MCWGKFGGRRARERGNKEKLARKERIVVVVVVGVAVVVVVMVVGCVCVLCDRLEWVVYKVYWENIAHGVYRVERVELHIGRHPFVWI